MEPIKLDDSKIIEMGHVGEHIVTTLCFDVSDWVARFPSGVVSLLLRRPGDAEAYPVSLIDGGAIRSYDITSADLCRTGAGQAQLVCTMPGDDAPIAKSQIWNTYVGESLDGSAEPPEPWQSWVDEVIEASAAARESAEAAASSETAADGSATGAAESAAQSEASAVRAEEAAETAAQEAAEETAEAVREEMTGYVTAAQTAQGAAESARDDTQGAVAAASAKAAEAVQSAADASAAKDAAETAQTAAEAAEDAAEAYAEQAQHSASQLEFAMQVEAGDLYWYKIDPDNDKTFSIEDGNLYVEVEIDG